MRHYKPVRGRILPVQVPLSATPEDIREAAATKHEAADRILRNAPCNLLFPDGTLVKKVPGSNEAFTLLKYKLFLGKTYKSLRLYTSPASDCLSGTLAGCISVSVGYIAPVHIRN